MQRRYSTTELEAQPTLAQSPFDNLKLDDGKTRVWLSRYGVADGAPFDNGVLVERLIRGVWTQVAHYPGGPSSKAVPHA